VKTERLKKFRKLLPEGYNPSDDELESIANDLTRFAEILVDAAIREQKHKSDREKIQLRNDDPSGDAKIFGPEST